MMRPLLRLAIAGTIVLAIASCNNNTTTPSGKAELDSPTLSHGQQYAHTFNSTGTFKYYCAIHPSCAGLMGTVTVVAADAVIQPGDHVLAVSQNSGGGCYALSATATTVHVGESVTWTNNSAAPHTITTQN